MRAESPRYGEGDGGTEDSLSLASFLLWPGFVQFISASIFPASSTGKRVRKNRSHIAKRKKKFQHKSVFGHFAKCFFPNTPRKPV